MKWLPYSAAMAKPDARDILKAERIRAGKKQRELAAVLDIDTTCYGRIEKHQRRLMFDEALLAARCLGISITTFLGEEEQERERQLLAA